MNVYNVLIPNLQGWGQTNVPRFFLLKYKQLVSIVVVGQIAQESIAQESNLALIGIYILLKVGSYYLVI